MTDGTQHRQRRRQQARETLDLGRKAIRHGLPSPPPKDIVVAAGLILRQKLNEPANMQRASEAADIAATLLDRSLAKQPAPEAIACRRGCAFCCHIQVWATPPEIFSVARWVQTKGARSAGLSPAAVLARAGRLSGIAHTRRQGLPCPLLVEADCGVYAARPQACRRFHSLSREACEAGGEVPDDLFSAQVGSLVHLLLVGALRSVGLPDASYELSDGLARVLPDPGMEARWLAGEAVFAGLATDRPRTAKDQGYVEQITGLIRAADA